MSARDTNTGGWVIPLLLAIAWTLIVLACAGTPVRPNTAPALEIDLSPRCLEIADDELSSVRPPGPAESRLQRAAGSAGVEIWSLATPRAARASISWGFPAKGDLATRSLAAVLLAEGETTTGPEDFRARIAAIGGRVAVHVERDGLWLELAFPEPKLSRALDLLFDWIEISAIDPDAFARIRRRVSLESVAASALPAEVAEQAFDRFQSGRPPEDSEIETRISRSPERMAAYLESVLRVDGSVLLYASTAHDANGIEALRSRIEATPGAEGDAVEDVHAEGPREMLRSEPRAIYVVDRPAGAQVEVLIGRPTVGPDHEDFAALEVLASLLGRDVGGRLFRDLRERHGLVYRIDAFQQPEARFVVTTRSRPERVVSLVRGIEDHLRALATLPLEACELEMLEARMLGEQALVRDDPAALRRRFREDVAWTGRPSTPAERSQRYSAAIRAGLGSVALRYLAEPPIVILVGEARQIRADFAAATPLRPVRVFSENLRSVR